VWTSALDAAPGTIAQVRTATHDLVRYAKSTGVAVILIGHVTKDGQIAGPKAVEHLVDAVLYFEGERGHHFRILRAVKNRFGATDEIGVFEMTGRGLTEVPTHRLSRRSRIFVSGPPCSLASKARARCYGNPGAGRGHGQHAAPRRRRLGYGRLAMLLAVLDARGGLE
jgi:DNA repair protein RadA/Sms